MSTSNAKALRLMIKAAESQGWVVERTCKNHYKFLPPLGGIYIAACTPSDHRAIRNTKSQLRKMGLKI